MFVPVATNVAVVDSGVDPHGAKETPLCAGPTTMKY